MVVARVTRLTDRLCVDHAPACPACGDIAHRTDLCCASCATPLYPSNSNRPPRHTPPQVARREGQKETNSR